MAGPKPADVQRAEAWRYAAARATGTSHLEAGIPCQDRFVCEVVEGSLVAALADGAGSAVHAEVGAEIAVATVVEYAKQALDRGREDYEIMLREAAELARTKIADLAAQEETLPRDYASTLLALILTPRGGAALQIGDGVIVVGDMESEWGWVFWPQHGEYANTTFFLIDDNASDQMETTALAGGIQDVALMSDGLESLALHYASQTAHQPFFENMFHSLVASPGDREITALSASLEQFLASERIAERTDDDVSLVLATRRPTPDEEAHPSSSE